MSPAQADETEIVVIGAGVVGMACAAELAKRGYNTVVVERHAQPGMETTSRNSEVIHAGIYYPADSLKAHCCVEGRQLLYERCARFGLPHRKTGKLIVATQRDELAALSDIRARALANGAGEIRELDGDEVARYEPRVRALGGLWSPETGIVDAHALLSSYQAEFESEGGVAVFQTDVTELARSADAWTLETRDASGQRFALRTRHVVNAAGLWADRIAALAGLDIDGLGWRLKWCKGDYFSAAPGLGKLTQHLVYPVPAGAGLGIHVTLDLGGRYRFGPDAMYVDAVDYRVDPAKAGDFARAVARYLPEIQPHHLAPEMAGIRPKLQGPGESFRDFVVAEAAAQGAPGLINLIGIESPGLTAAGAIARRVANLVN